MNKIKNRIKQIPKYGYIFGFLMFGLQWGLYNTANLLSRVFGTVSWEWSPKIDAIDDSIPIIAPFAVIYLFSFIFWICGPVAVSLTDKNNFANYIIGLTACYAVGFLIFLLLPTYMDREAENLLGIGDRNGIFNWLLDLIYSFDGSSKAYNLFPSYHCLSSAYCYFGVRKQEKIAKWFRVYSLIMAILICFSTVLTKQHYFLDVVGGLGIAVIGFIITEKLDPAGKMRILNKD